jgi:hypothetical protein
MQEYKTIKRKKKSLNIDVVNISIFRTITKKDLDSDQIFFDHIHAYKYILHYDLF